MAHEGAESGEEWRGMEGGVGRIAAEQGTWQTVLAINRLTGQGPRDRCTLSND